MKGEDLEEKKKAVSEIMKYVRQLTGQKLPKNKPVAVSIEVEQAEAMPMKDDDEKSSKKDKLRKALGL